MEENKMIINFSQLLSNEGEVYLQKLQPNNEFYYLNVTNFDWRKIDEEPSKSQHYNFIEDDEIRNSLLLKDNDL